MTSAPDRYEIYYADKLWNLLPAVYRSLDTDDFASNGPLREMVNRIGAQAAILRRSIDRAWEDQSIETCDDWLIPYIGDLLATNLVSNLDARAQRLDVAKTIYYRRRKGTLAVLEELAFDVTGWNARVIEFFRRMGRTRHGLDPAIGQAQQPGDDIDNLQRAEGLVGALSRTPIGGTANLRNITGASKTNTAFDEFFHTADMRHGEGQVGWHNIPRLGVFLWRLKSYSLPPTTPVAVKGCPGWFTFDPTGRDAPLFASASRTSDQYGSNWVSPVEEQLPGPISQTLFNTNESAAPADRTIELYSTSLSVLRTPVPISDNDTLAASTLLIRPARGRFHVAAGSPPQSPPAGSPGVWSTYCYGLSSEIGAGPYDRRLGRQSPATPLPLVSKNGGGKILATAGTIPSAGTFTITDSLTYDGASALTVNGALTINAVNMQRPLIRLPAPTGGNASQWIFTGIAGSTLILDGLFISGGDIVLRGDFQSVIITCCTLDPGTASDAPDTSPPQPKFATAADGRALAPTRLFIEATIQTLTMERSIAGPIQTRSTGSVQSFNVNDSIIQAIPGSVAAAPQSPPAPAQSGDLALALGDGDVCLSRCTVLGGMNVHRLSASECILQGITTVDDTQHGCVRFTAWAKGSFLPRKYESVSIPAAAVIFTSTHFGQPGYGQLLATADMVITPDPAAEAQNTISAGAQDGSEMGVFARERNPMKQRGLLIKFQEYMPVGLIPVVIFVT
ncbi:MAG TPA: hypothetical protein VGN88_10965 [Phycisphaerae bacterium]|jgi:hypothetical protein